MNIYAKHEATLDKFMIPTTLTEEELNSDRYRDVVLFRDSECTQFAQRFMWYFTSDKPKRTDTTIMYDYTKCNLVWRD